MEDPILLWKLDKSFVGNEPKWINGRVEIVAAEDIDEYRIEIQAVRGKNDLGFIAADDFVLADVAICEFTPEAAKPSTTTATTTTTTKITTQPTEPWCAKLYQHGSYQEPMQEVGVTSGQSLKDESLDNQISSIKVNYGCIFNGYDGYELDTLLVSTGNDVNLVGPEGPGHNDMISSYTCMCNGKLTFFETFWLLLGTQCGSTTYLQKLRKSTSRATFTSNFFYNFQKIFCVILNKMNVNGKVSPTTKITFTSGRGLLL